MVLILAGLVAGGSLLAQRGIYGGGQIYVAPETKTARERNYTRSTGTPVWVNPAGFKGDVFTFARLRYDTAPRPSYPTRRGGRGQRGPSQPRQEPGM